MYDPGQLSLEGAPLARQRITVELTAEEYELLTIYVAHGPKSAREINRARILLLAPEGLADADIAQVLGGCQVPVYTMRKKYQTKGPQYILDLLKDAPRSGRPMTLDRTVEAKVRMLACSDPPEGRARWTLQLIADKLVPLAILETISPESVRRL